jgi:hypothetical protein
MFERGEPSPSDRHLGHFYGLALPLLARGLPVTPVQLENAVIPGFLDPFRVLLLNLPRHEAAHCGRARAAGRLGPPWRRARRVR